MVGLPDDLPCEQAWHFPYNRCAQKVLIILQPSEAAQLLPLSSVPRKHQLFISELDTGKCHLQ